ncbi:MAG: YnbE family lipoprotein [Chlorobiaceae bacterium]
MKRKTIITMMTFLSITAGVVMTGCSPTVKIEAPDKPIVINMNIKIDHEIRIKVDRELDSLLDNKKGLF